MGMSLGAGVPLMYRQVSTVTVMQGTRPKGALIPGKTEVVVPQKELHDLLRITIIALQREVLLNPNLPHSVHPHSHANPEFP